MAPVTRRHLAAETTNDDNEFGLFANADVTLMKRALQTTEPNASVLSRRANDEVDLADLHKNELKRLCKSNGFKAPRSWTNKQMVSWLNHHKQQLLLRKEMRLAQVLEIGNMERDVASLKERLRCLTSETEVHLTDLKDKKKIRDDMEKKIIHLKDEKAKCLPRHGEEGLYEDLSTGDPVEATELLLTKNCTSCELLTRKCELLTSKCELLEKAAKATELNLEAKWLCEVEVEKTKFTEYKLNEAEKELERIKDERNKDVKLKLEKVMRETADQIQLKKQEKATSGYW